MSSIAIRKPQFSLAPTNFEEANYLAKILSESDFVPKDFKGKPGNCLLAIQLGNEVGLGPIQAVQNIAVINGRPTLWGDAVLALVRACPDFEYIKETQTAGEAKCTLKRKGETEVVRTFSMAEAKMAGLAGKAGPWTQYPQRMLQMRARSFACRDLFPDVLKGIWSAEEALDIPREIAMGEAEVVPPAVNSNLLAKASAAAAAGVAGYAEFWKSISKEERKDLAARHESFKAQAQSADAAKAAKPAAVVDAETGEILPGPAAYAAQKSAVFDEIMTAICTAKTLEDLYSAGEFIYQFSGDEEKILAAKFDEIKEALGGAK